MAKTKYPQYITCNLGYTWKLIDSKYGQYQAYLDSSCTTVALMDRYLPAFATYKWLIKRI